MQEYTLAQNRWYGDEPTTISLPDDWDVQFLSSRGDERSALSAEQIRERFRHPVGSRTIRELAENAEQVVIVFDDLTRGTPVQPIAEAVLEELHAAGIPKNHIRFICGTGLHGAHSRNDFARKLGERIIREYAVFNHNPYDNCAEVGFTPNGIRVSLNREFLSCDLKIAIGGVVPHPLNGFGGGGKIIMPGIASAEIDQRNPCYQGQKLHVRREKSSCRKRQPVGRFLPFRSGGVLLPVRTKCRVRRAAQYPLRNVGTCRGRPAGGVL